jgi:hypothetical protein
MGILQTADTMVDNSMKQLSDVLNSKFTTYLQGNGTPVLVTYYNIDANNSTTELGSGTYDRRLGDNSPLRFNKILDFPVYGLKDFIPTIDPGEGGLMDMEMDMEVVILPNSIKPSPLDHFVYRFFDGNMNVERQVTFRVISIEHSSIKSNNFYKLSLTLADINDEHTVEELDNQTISTFRTNIDLIGTNEQCIIEDTIFDRIGTIDNICDYLINSYMDVFYDDRYNALLLRDNNIGYPLFDPYLTTFIIEHNILDTSKRYIVLMNYDNRYDVSRMYNKTIYRSLEQQNDTHLVRMSMKPHAFETTATNPFVYYGEENVFSIDLVKPTEPKDYVEEFDIELVRYVTSKGNRFIYDYLDIELLNRIQTYQLYLEDENTFSNSLMFSNIFIKFFKKGNMKDLVTDKDIDNLQYFEVTDCKADFLYVPMIIYILRNYVRYLRNNQLSL